MFFSIILKNSYNILQDYLTTLSIRDNYMISINIPIDSENE